MIGKAKMIQLIHNGSSRRLERKMKKEEKKLFLFLCLDVQSVSVLQGGCDFFFNNDLTRRRVKLKIGKYIKSGI